MTCAQHRARPARPGHVPALPCRSRRTAPLQDAQYTAHVQHNVEHNTGRLAGQGATWGQAHRHTHQAPAKSRLTRETRACRSPQAELRHRAGTQNMPNCCKTPARVMPSGLARCSLWRYLRPWEDRKTRNLPSSLTLMLGCAVFVGRSVAAGPAGLPPVPMPFGPCPLPCVDLGLGAEGCLAPVLGPPAAGLRPATF